MGSDMEGHEEVEVSFRGGQGDVGLAGEQNWEKLSRCERSLKRKKEWKPTSWRRYTRFGYRFEQPLFEPRLLPPTHWPVVFLSSWVSYHFAVPFPSSCTDLTVLHTETVQRICHFVSSSWILASCNTTHHSTSTDGLTDSVEARFLWCR